jgi:hypothetical protein
VELYDPLARAVGCWALFQSGFFEDQNVSFFQHGFVDRKQPFGFSFTQNLSRLVGALNAFVLNV